MRQDLTDLVSLLLCLWVLAFLYNKIHNKSEFALMAAYTYLSDKPTTQKRHTLARKGHYGHSRSFKVTKLIMKDAIWLLAVLIQQLFT